MNPQPSIAVERRTYGAVRIVSSAATLIEDKHICLKVSLSGEETDIVWVHGESFLSGEPYFFFDAHIAQMYNVGVPTQLYPMSDVWSADLSFGVYNILECKFHEYTFEHFDYKGQSLIRSSSSSMPDADDLDLGLMRPVEMTLKYGGRRYSESRITPKETGIKKAMSIVADAFAKFSEVNAIYMQRWRSELQFVVLLNIEKYDSDLIDKLLDVEYELLQHEGEGVLWDFAYLPCKGRDSTEVVSSSATVVFSR